MAACCKPQFWAHWRVERAAETLGWDRSARSEGWYGAEGLAQITSGVGPPQLTGNAQWCVLTPLCLPAVCTYTSRGATSLAHSLCRRVTWPKQVCQNLVLRLAKLPSAQCLLQSLFYRIQAAMLACELKKMCYLTIVNTAMYFILFTVVES